jgi:hypothetical protein
VKEPNDSEARTFGRFRSKYLNGQLSRIVGEVALKVRPNDPHRLTQAQFDNNVGTAGYPDCPTARQIATRLKRPWAEVVEVAVDPKRSEKRTQQAKTREGPMKHITDRHVFFSLQRVARARGEDSFTEAEYAETREQLVAEDRRRWRYGGVLDETLLTSSQIVNYTDHDWNAALVLGGLKAHEPEVVTGMPIIDALDLYVVSTGLMAPSIDELYRMARELKIALRGLSREYEATGKRWADLVAEYEAWCVAQGLEVPARPPRNQNPVFNPPKSALTGATAARRKAWTEVECIDALISFIDTWPGSADPTQRQYKQAAKGNRDLPAASTLQRFGLSIDAALEKARKRRAAQMKKAA